MGTATATAEKQFDKKARVYEGSKDPKRAAFYEKISQRDMAPLWEVLKDLVAKSPKSIAAPAIWHFDEVKPMVEEAGGLLTAEEAERRVLDWTGFKSVPTIIAARPGEDLPCEEPAPLPKGSSPRGIDRGSMITEASEEQLETWLRKHGFIENGDG